MCDGSDPLIFLCSVDARSASGEQRNHILGSLKDRLENCPDFPGESSRVVPRILLGTGGALVGRKRRDGALPFFQLPKEWFELLLAVEQVTEERALVNTVEGGERTRGGRRQVGHGGPLSEKDSG